MAKLFFKNFQIGEFGKVEVSISQPKINSYDMCHSVIVKVRSKILEFAQKTACRRYCAK